MSQIPSTQPTALTVLQGMAFLLWGHLHGERPSDAGQSVLLTHPGLEAWSVFSNIGLHVANDFAETQRINQTGGLNAGPHLNLIHSSRRSPTIQCLP